MIKSGSHSLRLCSLLPLIFFLSFAATSPAQTAPAPPQNSSSDVVMLALQAFDPQVQHSQRVSEGLLDTVDHDLQVEQHLREIQMAIVRTTANFGPVLLLAPDDTTKSAISQRCQEFQICELLKSDRVRIKVAPHDGAWIRDFGPQIEAVGDSARVVHWRYFDIRKEEARRVKFQEIETARLKLLETRQQEEQQSALAPDATPESRKAVVSAIDAKLFTLQQYAQILREASVQRSNDEDSAYDIADAVLAAPDFHYQTSPIALDGGNLLKLEDGRCLTTRVLLTRNKDQSVNLDSELEKLADCKSVTYLDPLPGPVTEHIDMFALPVGGKRILLASYDLAKPFAAEYWPQLSPGERDLAMNAALAMESDADQLTRLGYEVLPVPSPFPRIPANGHVYYPTVLNALVREVRQRRAPSPRPFLQKLRARHPIRRHDRNQIRLRRQNRNRHHRSHRSRQIPRRHPLPHAHRPVPPLHLQRSSRRRPPRRLPIPQRPARSHRCRRNRRPNPRHRPPRHLGHSPIPQPTGRPNR